MDSGGGRGGGWDELDSQNPRSFPRDHFAGNTRATDKSGSARRVNAPLPRAESNRTLLDIIREEGGGGKDSKKTWRHFKDKLRRKNSGGRGSAWTSTVHVPASDIPINNRMISRHPSARINPNSDSDLTDQADISAVPDARAPSLVRNPSRAIERASGRFDYNAPFPRKKLQREDNYEAEEEDDDERSGSEEEESEKEAADEEEEEEGGDEERAPVRMSLMSLLAETDKQMGFDGLAYMMEEEEEDEDDDGGDGGGEYNICCVCMVRHKGVAFVPCGHSFCRLCSREMWVDRGNCPLCNNYILEILDIF
ncbi:hypothetical protein DH2020_021922 [Rehmannia glutinosa]|uniref:RING-type domain-containing protein n=1 Tax=Rehmannia glutinosa TaxID=99300 RepID=A0ABR0WCE3_REHGL